MRMEGPPRLYHLLLRKLDPWKVSASENTADLWEMPSQQHLLYIFRVKPEANHNLVAAAAMVHA